MSESRDLSQPSATEADLDIIKFMTPLIRRAIEASDEDVKRAHERLGPLLLHLLPNLGAFLDSVESPKLLTAPRTHWQEQEAGLRASLSAASPAIDYDPLEVMIIVFIRNIYPTIPRQVVEQTTAIREDVERNHGSHPVYQDPSLSRWNLLRSKRQIFEITFRAYAATLKEVGHGELFSFARDGLAWRIYTSGDVSQRYI